MSLARDASTTSLNSSVSSVGSSVGGGRKRSFYMRHSGKNIIISADIDGEFSEVKREVEEKTGESLTEHDLVLNGRSIKIADDKSLSYYGYTAGGFFTLKPKKK